MDQEPGCKIYERMAAVPLSTSGIRPGGIHLTERALEFCSFAPGSRVVDVGCGTGVSLGLLRGKYRLEALGIDPSAVLLEHCRETSPAFSIVRGSGEALPLPAGFADGILSECSLSTMDDSEKALDEFGRVLKNQGRLILSDLYCRDTAGILKLRALAVGCCLRGALDLGELETKLKERGFVVELIEDHSDALRDFAAQLVWDFGSLEAFWKETAGPSMDAGHMRQAISSSKPGYFLLVARKDIGAAVG